MNPIIIEIIQSIILIIIAIITIIISIGLLRLNNKLENVVYARIHILGAIDIMAVVSFLVLGNPLLAVLYFILAPFTAHAIAHGFYYGEDRENNNEDIKDDTNLNEDNNQEDNTILAQKEESE